MKLYKRMLCSLQQAEYDACLRQMSPERRQAVEKMTDRRRRQTVLGEWMAKKELAAAAGLQPEQITLVRDKAGKPTAVGLPLHFNISHTDELVVCAIADRPIGVDAERLRPLHPGLAGRLCTPSDADYLAEADGEEEYILRLLRIWTAKEAYFKWKGSGITDLKEIGFAEILPHLQQQCEGEYIISIVY